MEYEDYSRTSQHYDDSRTPIGVEILLGCFASGPRPLGQQIILDGGCGTGNYLTALQGRVNQLHGVELNEGMLRRVREKFADSPTVDLRQGDLLDLPFTGHSMDGMMCNQVTHHLDGEDDDTFNGLRRMLTEAHRVLRPGGILVINTCSEKQLYHGYWWAELIRPAIDRLAKRYCPLDTVEELLRECGFGTSGRAVPTDAVLQGEQYFHPLSPLRESFRDGDSTWSLLSAGQLEHALGKISEMNREGSLEAYVAGRDSVRKDVGQCTFVYARKLPSSPSLRSILPLTLEEAAVAVDGSERAATISAQKA